MASSARADPLPYSAHTFIATVLDELGCSPEAAGLQWLKAAAHAETDEQVGRAARALAEERLRSGDAEVLDAALCAYVVDGFASSQQAEALRVAGMRCPTQSGAP